MPKNSEILKEKFKILYLSGNYNLTQIAHELKVSRTSVYQWKRQLFPKNTEHDFKRRMFQKLNDSGLFTPEEMTRLLKIHPGSLERFKRDYQKFRQAEKRHNILNNSSLWSNVVKKAFKWLN
jgi:predicted DNA-binding protein YlxM (UPF0122 family)